MFNPLRRVCCWNFLYMDGLTAEQKKDFCFRECFKLISWSVYPFKIKVFNFGLFGKFLSRIFKIYEEPLVRTGSKQATSWTSFVTFHESKIFARFLFSDSIENHDLLTHHTLGCCKYIFMLILFPFFLVKKVMNCTTFRDMREILFYYHLGVKQNCCLYQSLLHHHMTWELRQVYKWEVVSFEKQHGNSINVKERKDGSWSWRISRDNENFYSFLVLKNLLREKSCVELRGFKIHKKFEDTNLNNFL